jgi:hypothetical protein
MIAGCEEADNGKVKEGTLEERAQSPSRKGFFRDSEQWFGL